MSFLSWLPNAVMGSLVGPVLSYLEKRTDADVQKLQIREGMSRDAALAIIKDAGAAREATRDVILAAMSHPIWWVAWAIFVVPVGLYHAAIFGVSTLDAWINTPGCHIPELGEAVRAGARICEAWVRRVPATQEAWAQQIIGNVFLAQAGTGAVAGIVSAVSRRLAR